MPERPEPARLTDPRGTSPIPAPALPRRGEGSAAQARPRRPPPCGTSRTPRVPSSAGTAGDRRSYPSRPKCSGHKGPASRRPEHPGCRPMESAPLTPGLLLGSLLVLLIWRSNSMKATTLTSKAQVAIPKEILAVLGLKTGDRVLFLVQDGEVVVRPVKSFRAYRGSVPSRRGANLSGIRRAVRATIGRRRMGAPDTPRPRTTTRSPRARKDGEADAEHPRAVSGSSTSTPLPTWTFRTA